MVFSFIKKRYKAYLKNKKDKYLQSLINNGLFLGEDVEIIDDFFFDPSHCFLISIGSHTTICPNVRLIAHDASTKKLLGYTKIGKIEIGEYCFIGDSAIILPNVKIGSNTIVGAGSVVTRNIPAGSVAAGNPARVVSSTEQYKQRFKKIGDQKKIFGNEYLIRNLDKRKRNEILQSIDNDFSFIV